MAERDTHRHGGLVIETERLADGSIEVRVFAGMERVAVKRVDGETLRDRDPILERYR